MNFHHINTIFKKEFTDLFRDKKTIIGTLIVPLLLFPLLMLIMGGGLGSMMNDAFEDPAKAHIAVALHEDATEDMFAFAQNELFAGTEIEITRPEDLQSSLENGDISVILELEPDFRQKLDSNIPLSAKLVYNEMDSNTAIRAEAVAALINRYNTITVYARLDALGISPDILTPITAQNVTLSDYFGVTNRSGSQNMFLQMMLPYLAAILAASSGLSAAVDMIAGEKERNTLEPLLSTAANRSSVLFGKFLVVVAFTMLGVIAQGIGMAIGFSIFGSNFAGSFMSGGINISAGVLLLVLLGFILMGMTFSCIAISLSAVSKTYKEAQTYSSYVVFIPMIIGFFSMFMSAKDVSLWMMFVPVMNIVSAMKLVLGGNADLLYLLCGVGSSLIYMLLALSLVRRLFSKEKYMFRS